MANHPARTESPAVAEFASTLRSAVSMLRGGIGTLRNDGSRHTAGLAIDIMLNSRDPIQKAKADQIIDAIISLQSRMGWHDILYTDWLPSGLPFHFHIPGGGGGYGGRRFEKNPNKNVALGREHENHIHVDWVDFSLRIVPHETTFVYDWPRDALKTGFGGSLAALI